MTVTNSFSFSETKKTFELLLEKETEVLSKKNLLTKAFTYALTNGGKRLRPLIVYLVADAINSKEDVSPSALCIEFFHTASLIADDLPCMDNDDYRREKPSLHKKFTEATALLASYSLIIAAFEKIYENGKKSTLNQKEERCLIAIKEASNAAGIKGATGGQFLDLFCKKPTLKELEEIIKKKTVMLFEVSFALGWIFGGGEISRLDEIKEAGYHFGFAFQIADDLKDFEQDLIKKNPVNYSVCLGKKESRVHLERHLFLFLEKIERLEIKREGFFKLKQKLIEYIKEEHA